MSVIDKFLNAMKMNDDDDEVDGDYLDDEYDDDDDLDDLDFDEDKPRRHFLTRSKQDDSYPETTEASSGPTPAVTTPSSKAVRSSRPSRSSSKVSPMRSSGRKSGMEVCVIRPKSMEDAREVTETLLDECTVILNMEGIDFELAQRIIDFACGSCYAISGKLQKISNYIFIITPASVDISGDFQEMVNGSYDVPAFGSDY